MKTSTLVIIILGILLILGGAYYAFGTGTELEGRFGSTEELSP